MSRSITVILLLLVSGSIMVNGYLIWDSIEKENTISFLENNLSNCLDDAEYLVNLVSELENRKLDLEADINFYEYRIENLQNEKTNLEIELKSADNQINNLYDDVLELNETNNKFIQLYSGNGLTSFFDNLREEEGLTGGGERKNLRKEMEFSINLVKHAMGENIWASLDNDYFQSTSHHSYTQAFQITCYALKYVGCNENDTNVIKLEKILDFVNEQLVYELEFDDIFRAPAETLTLRSGDCDDYCILTATLSESIGIETAIIFLKNDLGVGHVMILVNMNDLGEYGYYSFSDLTDYGLGLGKWIMIEPQMKINQQDDDEWFSQWEIRDIKEIS